MNKIEKKDFVRSICSSIAEEVCDHIELDKVPEAWDGFELREILSDKFKRESVMPDHRIRRYKDYLNDVIVNNL